MKNSQGFFQKLVDTLKRSRRQFDNEDYKSTFDFFGRCDWHEVDTEEINHHFRALASMLMRASANISCAREINAEVVALHSYLQSDDCFIDDETVVELPLLERALSQCMREAVKVPGRSIVIKITGPKGVFG